jgi:hypothetical protein
MGPSEHVADSLQFLGIGAKAAGEAAEVKVFDGMVHSWQRFATMLDGGHAVDQGGDSSSVGIFGRTCQGRQRPPGEGGTDLAQFVSARPSS